MARVHNFSAGPAALPTSVLAEIADEMMDYRGCGMSVLEMSHRSSMYQQIIDDAEATLRRLLSIPDNYRVLFLQGGATLQFAGIPMNLMRRGRAGYIVTGSSPCGLPVTDIECPRGRLSHERRPRFCKHSIKCTEPLLGIQSVC